jgi:hypothetical protein
MRHADPRRRRARTAAVLASFVVAAAPHAHADGTVEAELLFQDGRRLLAAGEVADACDKFEASERIEPTVGVLLNAADCREKNHQLATAWAYFLEAAALAHREGNDVRREAEARHRAALLEPRLSYLVVSVPEASKIDGLVLRRAGTVIDPALWNQGVPVDAGTYEVSASAPGHEPWSTRIDVTGEGSKAVVEVPRFRALAELVAPAPAPAPRDDEDPTADPPTLRPEPIDRVVDAEPEPSRFTRTRELAIGVAVIGAVSIAGGDVLWQRAQDLSMRSDAVCPGAVCNDPGALAMNRDARSDATAADVLFIGGGAAVAGAAVLWLTGGPAAPAHAVVATPLVTPSSFGLAVAGRF